MLEWVCNKWLDITIRCIDVQTNVTARGVNVLTDVTDVTSDCCTSEGYKLLNMLSGYKKLTKQSANILYFLHIHFIIDVLQL
jgi:hypothetical protein